MRWLVNADFDGSRKAFVDRRTNGKKKNITSFGGIMEIL